MWKSIGSVQLFIKYTWRISKIEAEKSHQSLLKAISTLVS